jgi:uncharacterized RDD family membrane protein YckC
MDCAQCGQWIADGESACSRCGAPAHGAAVGAFAATADAVAAAPGPAIRYAGFWRRFWTGLVDGLVMFFPSAIVRVLFGENVLSTANPLTDPAAMRGAIVNLLLYWLYCALLESSGAQGTLGQQLLGLRVRDVQLRRISFVRATARHFSQWLSLFTCCVGYLLNLWTGKRQTLHDLVAGCVIARADSLPDAAPGGRA